jgi:hypothetical protein
LLVLLYVEKCDWGIGWRAALVFWVQLSLWPQDATLDSLVIFSWACVPSCECMAKWSLDYLYMCIHVHMTTVISLKGLTSFIGFTVKGDLTIVVDQSWSKLDT